MQRAPENAVSCVYPRTLPGGAFSRTTIAELAALADPRLHRILDVYDQRLETQSFAAGASLSLADFLDWPT